MEKVGEEEWERVGKIMEQGFLGLEENVCFEKVKGRKIIGVFSNEYEQEISIN